MRPKQSRRGETLPQDVRWGGDPTGLLDVVTWSTEMLPKDWEGILRGAEDEDTLRALRVRAQTGRPLARDSFMRKPETFLGRRIRPLPVGREQGWHKDKAKATGQRMTK